MRSNEVPRFVFRNNKIEIIFDKPFYLGLAILDKMILHMYEI